MRTLASVTFFAVACLACGASPAPAYAQSAPTEPPPGNTPDPPPDDAPPAQEMPIGVATDAYADTDPSALTDYRATLDPHGSWVDDPTYGTIWVPNPDEVGADFTPYATAGHWVYDDDYAWVSDYAWGWAPFHYGRWVWMRDRRWAWIPGREYAGAWVVWRTGDDAYPYVGWSPAPPNWIWRGGVAVGIGFRPWGPYVFCGREDVFAPTLGARLVGGDAAVVIAAHTRPYVVATPTVAAGHPFAQGTMHGPPPAALGIEAAHVAHAPPGEHGLTYARQFARPSTAQPLGARPAVAHVVRARPIVMPPSMPRPAPRAMPSRGVGGGGGHHR